MPFSIACFVTTPQLTPWLRPLVVAVSLLAFLPTAAQADETKTNTAEVPADLPLDELRSFAEVYERIKQAYVHEVTDKTLLENAIRGMLDGLDPHSGYLEADAFQQLRESTQGEFGGLGLEVGMENGYIKVISPLDDTPASRAGLQPLDLITHINKTSTRELTLEQAIEKMRGEPGTSVQLTILRETVSQPFNVELTRDRIRTVSVRHELLEKDYGYLRISQFQTRSGEEARKALEQLQASNTGPLKGLVLDLRNNPGGVLQAAADISDLFLDGGLIVYTQGRLPDTEMRFEASPGDVLEGIPLVVLINAGSASASEIVAGALQDQRRALIMGSPSFGKGSVQTVLPLRDDRGLKMTTALYYTPQGRSIQAEGIQPDISVINARITPIEEQQRPREADLQGHLQSSQPERAPVPEGRLTSPEDYPLSEALNLLKGLNFFAADPL